MSENKLDPAGCVLSIEDGIVPRQTSEDGLMPLVGTIYFGFASASSAWPPLVLIDDEGCTKSLRGNPVLVGTKGRIHKELCVPIFKAEGYDLDGVRSAIIEKLDMYLRSLASTIRRE